MTIINKKTPIKNMNDIKGNLTQKIRSWKRFKLSVLFTAVAVLSAALVFYAPFCYAGGVNNSGTQNKNKSAEKVKSSGIAYPYYLKRDPFQTFLYAQKSASSFKVGELPLLQYAVSSLKVVGIMSRRGKYFAMVQTPDGRSYIVTEGSLIGVNRAKVVSITSNAVHLIERTYNILGQIRSMNLVMPLQ
jgi:hypothetical protein